jgi:hypothetical protein
MTMRRAEITQDENETHIDWEHENVTAKMVDWFWSNMEKGMLLWHPSQHEPLQWAIPPKPGNPVGSVHIAPQTWNDGTRQNLYIRFEDLNKVAPVAKQYIIYEHVAVVAGIGLGPEALKNDIPWGWRIHQWQKTDYGIVGKSSAIGNTKKESKEDGKVWAAHCIEEVGNWGVFLPTLYPLYMPVTNPEYNLYADLSVTGKGVDAKYKYIKG